MSRESFGSQVHRLLNERSIEEDLGARFYHDAEKVSRGRTYQYIEGWAEASIASPTTIELAHNLGRVPIGMVEGVHGSVQVSVRYREQDITLWTKNKVVFQYTNGAGVRAEIRLLIF